MLITHNFATNTVMVIFFEWEGIHIGERKRKDFEINSEQVCIDRHYLVVLIFYPLKYFIICVCGKLLFGWCAVLFFHTCVRLWMCALSTVTDRAWICRLLYLLTSFPKLFHSICDFMWFDLHALEDFFWRITDE